ncbi:MAG: IS1634 family transposase [Bacteroidetes bacterium]|nr:IS1634 family transposase [Bacteroidota bacterium]
MFDASSDNKTSVIEGLSNDDIKVVGPELVFGKIFSHIGFNSIPDELFKDLTISRITHPGSKLKLAEYLQENGKKDISVDNIYRFLDKLSTKYKYQVEDISFAYTKKILGGTISVVFYDMTTIYFESSQPDELRMTGFSKDGKHQNPQIFLGLLVGVNGYPIGYEIFEGNTFEGHTLIPVLDRFQKRFDLDKPIVVADAGLLSKDNLHNLKKDGYSFIIGARIKNESRNIIEKIKQIIFSEGSVEKIEKEDNTVLFVSYSDKRAKKDASNRERGLKRLEKNLNAGRLTKSNINNRGYNKYLKMSGNIDIEINYEKYQADSNWDGLKGYITNTNLSGSEVISNYNNLWKIEKAFRISKTDLKIRPVYHRLRRRIEAHICVSFVSYLLYKEFENALKKYDLRVSVSKAIEATNKMYEITIQDENGLPRHVKLKNNKIQQEILDVISNEY